MKNAFDPNQHDIGYLLTAYADGQLAPDGMQWVEQQLVERPELKLRLDEIRSLQQMLRSGLAGLELPLALTDTRRIAVLTEAGREPVTTRKIRFHWPMIVGLAAACLTVAVVVTGQPASSQRFEPALRLFNGMQEHEVTFADAGNIAAVKEGGALYYAAPLTSTTAAPSSGFAGGDVDRLMAKRDKKDLGGGRGAFESVDERDILTSAKNRELAKLAESNAETNKGREEAVATSEMGATGGYMVPGQGKPKNATAAMMGRRTGADAKPAAAPIVVAGLPQQGVQNADRADIPAEAEARKAPQSAAKASALGVADGRGRPGATTPAAPPAPTSAPVTAPAPTPDPNGYTRRNEVLAYNGKQLDDQQKMPSESWPLAPATAAAAPVQPAKPQATELQLARRGEAKLKRVSESLHKSLQPQDKLLVMDEKAEQEQPVDGSGRQIQQAQQAQDADVEGDKKAHGLARAGEVTMERTFGNAVGQRDAAEKMKDVPADRRQVLDDTRQRHIYLRQFKNVEIDARRAAPVVRGPHDSATNRALLSEVMTVSGLGDTTSMLTQAAGDADVLVAQTGLPQLRTNVLLYGKDFTRGQAVVQVARAAGLQITPVDGALGLDAPRGQLDPTSAFGYDRDTFRTLFGTAPMVATAEDARSTFALDAETASYDRARAQVAAGQRIDPTAIRPEHFINAMPMDYPAASGPEAFTLYAEAAPSTFAATGDQAKPWSSRTMLVAIGVVARPAGADERRPLHLTLAIDCSGSMGREGGLARVQTGLAELVSHLRADDTVAVVAFSDQARLVLPATPGSERARITTSIAGLTADGATNAVDGLGLAYQVAAEGITAGAESRVVLASDGATLAGPGDAVEAVLARVRAHRERGVSLLVVGSGAGSYQAAVLERLANRADGQQVFLGSDEEAKRIFGGRLLPERLGVLAKDAKVQVTWNPQRISHARLIGYEQRRLAHQDFRNDAVDAGELSHDAQVTALYEVLLIDGATGPLGTAAVRYHDTRLQQVRELACPLPGAVLKSQPSDRLRLLASAAETAEWLQRGWWSNVRLPDPERIFSELARCPQPAARELENLVRRVRQTETGNR